MMSRMHALRYSNDKGLRLEQIPQPEPQKGEALIKVIYAGICSTDLEIIKGYVPGYDSTLGHEFVGIVAACESNPSLVGKRVVGEINCPCAPFEHPDPVMVRNHAPERTVLGIIARDGAMAGYVCLPANNLHLVPDKVPAQHAAFAEPLAAACRIVEQQAVPAGSKVAVIGDGKLGLLVAQVLALQRSLKDSQSRIWHFGRHAEKLQLVKETETEVVQDNDTIKEKHGQAFDVVIEASGSSQGIMLAAAICRPMGTIVLKSTCSLEHDANMPPWSGIANDIVVNEKQLRGSRCGPFPPALEALQHPAFKSLLTSMTAAIVPLTAGVKAVDMATQKGTLKVLLKMAQ